MTQRCLGKEKCWLTKSGVFINPYLLTVVRGFENLNIPGQKNSNFPANAQCLEEIFSFNFRSDFISATYLLISNSIVVSHNI